MWQEFKEFAMKGNVLDLAIGVIIGAAFGKIVDSLVKDVIMPIVAGIFGTPDFSQYFFPLGKSVTAKVLEEAQKQGPVLAWGSFLTVVVNFLIIAFVLFLVVKGVNKMKRAPAPVAAEPPAPPRSEVLLEQIRDLMAKK